MTRSIAKSVLKISSSIMLAVMTVAGVGTVAGSQSARIAGDEAATVSGTSKTLNLACHESGHRCQPTCGVRG